MGKKKELAEIFGNERIMVDRSVLEQYAGDESFVLPTRPECAVMPMNADELQRLVRWANETLTPLVPVSSRCPHFRGDSVPTAEGSVVVDLGDMKNVLRIDRKNRVVMIEPGVTFSELRSTLSNKGLRLNMPLLPHGLKSVVGSVLEREPVIMPKYHWDMVDPLACTEVIFGSGDLYRTGSAVGPGTIEAQRESGGAQKSPAGPLADWGRIIQGSQGTMGIVTWATIRCERMPELEEPYLVGSSSLPGLFELIHWLIRLRLVDECLVLNSSNVANILSTKWPEEYDHLRKSMPAWVLLFCISGYEYCPEEKVAYQKEEMEAIARRVGLEPVQSLHGISAHDLLETVRTPSKESYWKLRRKGSFHDIFYLTTHGRIPEFIEVMREVAKEYHYPLSDLGIYLQPVVQGTSCHCEFNLFFNPETQKERKRIKELSTQAVSALMDRGAFFSRPYGHWSDLVYERDIETMASLMIIKEILDPNNIMNPGKLCFKT